MQIPRQRIIILAISIMLAAVTVLMIKNYIDDQRQSIMQEVKKAMAGQEQAGSRSAGIMVLVAVKDIAKGAKLSQDNTALQVVPAGVQLPSDSITASPEKALGMAVTAPIARGEPITHSKLGAGPATKAQAGTTVGLAEVTPPGKRAITVSVDNIASLAGLIKPSDRVDVIAVVPAPVKGSASAEKKPERQTIVTPLFQNVTVLAVGQEIGPVAGGAGPKKAGESPLITLALTPEEADMVAFVQEQGKIRLILRSPADTGLYHAQPANWEKFFQQIKPDAEKNAEQKALIGPKVEIYRGLNKEEIPLKER